MPSALIAAWFTKSEGKVKVPLFIIGFVAAAVISTLVPQFGYVWHGLNGIAKQSLVVTLFLIGSGMTRHVLAKTGIRPLAQGISLWVIVSVVSCTAILQGWIK